MGITSKGGQFVKNKSKSSIVKVEEDSKEEIKLGAQDTDFLLKLFMDSSFKGNEVDKAHSVLSKLAHLHRENINGK
jgi:hypothetical protein